MDYVYHAVPETMIGHILLPLNAMSGPLASLREKLLENYVDRPEVLKKRVALLDCYWNDVIHLLPVHPQAVFDLQKQLGIIPTIPPYRFYKIPVSLLDPAKTVVYQKWGTSGDEYSTTYFNDVNFADITYVPEATEAYFTSQIGASELPFNYQFIPHVLTTTPIDIASVEIITLEDSAT